MATVRSGLTPSEVLFHLGEFEKVWGGRVKITLTVESVKSGGLFYQVLVETDAEITPEGDREHFSASSRWPTMSHETMLGLVFWLAHNVDQQVHASRTLRAR